MQRKKKNVGKSLEIPSHFNQLRFKNFSLVGFWKLNKAEPGPFTKWKFPLLEMKSSYTRYNSGG